MLGIDDINNLQSENEQLKTKLAEVVAERTQLKKLFAEIYDIANQKIECFLSEVDCCNACEKLNKIRDKVKEIYPS